ncbi:hypothetical protein EBZ38_14545 [bacterium]|nr:hypothetical protein [bacterium]NBX97831.1 hypothetical protein [bacterium]NDD85477.1 hypothetical protein [bacterium]
MPEGLPRTPNQSEVSDKPAAKTPESGRFKLFLQELFSDKSDNKESDDEEEKKKDKKGRFTRAWQKLFPSVAQKETIEGVAARSGSGLFFERSDVVEPPVAGSVLANKAPHTNDQHPADTNESVVARTDPATEQAPDQQRAITEEPASTYESANRSPEPTSSGDEELTTVVPEIAPTSTEQSRTVIFDRVPDEAVAAGSIEAAPTPQPQVIERSAAPERVVASLNTTERMRQSRIERRQKDIEHEVKRTNKELKHQEPDVVYQLEKAPQNTPVERTPVPKPNSIETVKTVEKPVVKTEIIERTVDIKPESQPKPEQKRVAEELLRAEIKEVTEDSKEIAYELSHEHKDMDKQAAGAWAALQASADAQAKINAAAIAAAQAASKQAAQDIGSTPVSSSQNSVYKQAITGGFITALVIIALIIVFILIQSR